MMIKFMNNYLFEILTYVCILDSKKLYINSIRVTKHYIFIHIILIIIILIIIMMMLSISFNNGTKLYIDNKNITILIHIQDY